MQKDTITTKQAEQKIDVTGIDPNVLHFIATSGKTTLTTSAAHLKSEIDAGILTSELHKRELELINARLDTFLMAKLEKLKALCSENCLPTPTNLLSDIIQELGHNQDDESVLALCQSTLEKKLKEYHQKPSSLSHARKGILELEIKFLDDNVLDYLKRAA